MEKDSKGRTILHYAAKNGSKEVFQHLTDQAGISLREEDINAKDVDSNACIHLAIKNGRKDLANYLVTTFKSVIQLNEKNGEGLTPFLLAVNRGCRHILHLLIDQGTHRPLLRTRMRFIHVPPHTHTGVDVSKGGKEQVLDAKNGQGKGFVHLAAENDNLECLSYLLERVGKERVKHTLGERDSNNDTPFNLAAKNGNISAMLLLLGKKKETDPASVLGAAMMTSPVYWCSQIDRATARRFHQQQGARRQGSHPQRRRLYSATEGAWCVCRVVSRVRACAELTIV